MKRAVVGLLVVALLAATAVLFVWPQEDSPRGADAVVVLSGARDSRLARGLELMRAGAARTLVISDGRARGWTEGNRLCASRTRFGYEVVCFRPRPYSTQGEAADVARIARRRGWDSLVVVTSRYHVTRSRLLFSRCTDAAVHGVAAKTSVLALARNLPFEWGKLLYQLTVERDC